MKIDNNTLQRFLLKTGDRLSGDWVIIGGAVLQLLNIDIRVTTDIDIAGPETATQRDMIELMDIAAELNLPVEAINQAAGYFLAKVKNWQNSLVLVHAGSNARIYRPNINLFITLKINRLSESDYNDCIAMIDYAAKNHEVIDAKKLVRLIDATRKSEENDQKRGRLKLLKDYLLGNQPTKVRGNP